MKAYVEPNAENNIHTLSSHTSPPNILPSLEEQHN